MKHRCKDTKNWAKKQNSIKKRFKKRHRTGFSPKSYPALQWCSVAVRGDAFPIPKNISIYLYIL